MAARSARIENTNIGAIGRALQGGTDLVEMTTMPQCCKLCGAYQGKVYSISGKDKRFPALFKTVLKNGYALPHPNCRHEFIPYYEEIEDPEDVKKDIAKSKIKYDSKGNLVDVRHQADIKGYQAWQAGNRQLNRGMHEYEQMQAYYESKGLEAPYKTLGAFRRARRAQAQSYKDNRKEWSEKVQFSEGNSKNTSLNSRKRLTNEEKRSRLDEKGETSVNWSKVKTKSYQDNLYVLVGRTRKDGTSTKPLVNSIRNSANNILLHRDGTTGEDLYVLDERTGAVLYVDKNEENESRVDGTRELEELYSKKDGRSLITVHNHPNNGFPSATDFNTLYSNPKIKYGIIVAHNGKVYKYTAPKRLMPKGIIRLTIAKYKNYAPETAKKLAYKELQEKFGFTLEVME